MDAAQPLFAFGRGLLLLGPELQALFPPSPLAVQLLHPFDLLVLAHVTSLIFFTATPYSGPEFRLPASGAKYIHGWIKFRYSKLIDSWTVSIYLFSFSRQWRSV